MAVDKADHPEPEEHKDHDGADSDEESDIEEIENIPLVDVDVTGLNPLSPEVISKQARLLLEGRKSHIMRRVTGNDKLGHDRTRSPRKINSRESDLWRLDCSIQERARPKHHHQARVRQRKSLYTPLFFSICSR